MSSQTHFHSAPANQQLMRTPQQSFTGKRRNDRGTTKGMLMWMKIAPKVWMAVEELCGSRLNGFPSPTETAVDITHTNIIHRHLHHLEPLQPTPPHPHSSTVLRFIWERTSHKKLSFYEGWLHCVLCSSFSI